MFRVVWHVDFATELSFVKGTINFMEYYKSKHI